MENSKNNTIESNVTATIPPPPPTTTTTTMSIVPFSAKLLAQSVDNMHSGREQFPKGCQFSPDGLCILTATCHRLQLYNTQPNMEWKSVLSCETGDSVRSYDWFPRMNSSDPSTCCFAVTSRDQPVHLYDAYTGGIRATYCPYNRLDEMESPSTVTFVQDGSRILTGGFHTDRMLHVFDVSRPGRESTIFKLGKTRRSKDGQKGLVSAITCQQDSNLIAVGTYSPGSIYLYDDRAQCTETSTIISGTCVVGHGKAHGRKRKHFHFDNINGNNNNNDDNSAAVTFDFSAAKVQWYQSRAQSGVTQLTFDDHLLYSSSRKSNAILVWDLRFLTSSSSSRCPGIASFETANNTNQRLEFQVYKSRYLFVGGCDKCVRIYNIKSNQLVGTIKNQSNNNNNNDVSKVESVLDDVTNGVSLTSAVAGKDLVAIATGSRHFPSEYDLDDSDEDYNTKCTKLNPPGHLRLLHVTLPHD